jgi:hypothetical protein
MMPRQTRKVYEAQSIRLRFPLPIHENGEGDRDGAIPLGVLEVVEDLPVVALSK